MFDLSCLLINLVISIKYVHCISHFQCYFTDSYFSFYEVFVQFFILLLENDFYGMDKKGMFYLKMNGMCGKIWTIGANGGSNWSYYDLKTVL